MPANPLATWRDRRALRAAAAKYFTEDELVGAEIVDRELVVHDARFRLTPDRGDLDIAQAPDDEWLRGHLATLDDRELRVWEAVAFLKVRRIVAREEVERRARTGELYDESYFTRRGGGAPYVGYPREASGHMGWTEEVASELVETYRPASVLDVGCATGEMVRALEQRGVRAAGIDISAWAYEHRVSDAVVLGSAAELPWPDASFDVVISHDFMEHVHPDELPRVLAEQARVTRPGGHVVHLIPFYDFDEPIQVDAHLTQADRAWWLRLFARVPELEMTREALDKPDVDFASGKDAPKLLPYYFEFTRRGG